MLYRIFCSLYRIFCFNQYCNTSVHLSGIWLLLVHTLCLAHFAVQLDNTTHTCGTHTVFGSVLLQYIYTLVQSLFTLRLCTQPNVNVPIIEELQFTCFALIDPSPPLHPDLNCCLLTQPFCPAERAVFKT
jgi:hypothetical protein